MEIRESARKHHIADADIRHALRNRLLTARQDNRRNIVLGTARDGQILELVILFPRTNPAVIHAMKARPKFLRLLER